MRSLLNSLVVITCLGAGGVLHANPALACSEPPCRAPVRLFEPGAHVPGNLVYFKVIGSNPGELSLHTTSGTKIPASIRQIGPDRVFAPDAPIAAGTQVRLDYVYDCRGTSDGRELKQSYLFTTTSHVVAAPDRGSLEQRERGFFSSSPTTDGDPFVRLTHASPSSARHLVDSVAEVDGKPVQFDYPDRNTLTVRSSCNPAHRLDADSCGYHHRFAPGEHKVVVRYTMVGGLVELPSVETQISLRCEDARPCAAEGSTTPPQGDAARTSP